MTLPVDKIPRASDLFFSGRSLSLAKVTKASTGIINVISTTEVQSSGGVQLDGDNCAFGLSICGFYDIPQDVPPAVWTVRHNGHPFLYDVVIPESGDLTKPTRKNRNHVLSVFHSCVKEMLSSL